MAYGKKYVDEAIHSAKSVKENMPEVGISIASGQDINKDVFDKVVNIDIGGNGYVPTCHFINMSPYEKTLHLDTDTHVASNISELFEMLDKWDLLATHAPYREQPHADIDIPSSFPEINGGVLAFNNNKYFDRFHSNWLDNYSDIDCMTEQPSLRKTLFDNNIDFYILPPEYNCRDIGYLHGKAKIFHFRKFNNLDEVRNKINNTAEQRVHYCGWNGIKIVTHNSPMTMRISQSVKNVGIKETLKRGLKKLL